MTNLKCSVCLAQGHTLGKLWSQIDYNTIFLSFHHPLHTCSLLSLKDDYDLYSWK